MSPTSFVPAERDRRWWQYIGPWPFRPTLVFVTTWLFYNSTAVGAATVGDFNPARFIGSGLLESFISSLPVTAVVWLGRRWQNRYGQHWGSYVLFIVGAVVGAVIVRFFLVVDDITTSSFAGPLAIASTRITLFLVVVLAVAGVVTERLQNQVFATKAALEESRRQQDQILKADEDARRQVADLLHDRVQAGLIAACLELQALPEDDRQKDASISTIVKRLETIRGIDVKRAARALSPSLQDVDLHAAVRELASQYEPRTQTSVDVASDVERRISDLEMRLGLYRLTEQALLNAVVHGHARHVDVSIRIQDESTIVWEVRDDGRGLSTESVEQGLGSALMTTWMRRLGGEWSLEPREGGGACCRASMPLA